MKTYDEKLRHAMNDIYDLLRKYDIAGFIVLESKTHGEFKMAIDHMSWSNIRFLKEGQAAHIKIYAKSDKENTEATVGAIANIRDMCAMGFQQTEFMMNKIEQQVKVEHIRSEITNEDR